jgi:hypothetical protein
MQIFVSLLAVAAAASTAAAGDIKPRQTSANAPVVTNNPIADTYSATLPNKGTNSITGAVKGASAPSGEGVNFQIAFYSLPSTSGNLSYSIHTGRVSSTGDCSNVGDVLNPYGGTTGSGCKSNDLAGCAVGDLSDKHGDVPISSGGSGTGYFAAK